MRKPTHRKEVDGSSLESSPQVKLKVGDTEKSGGDRQLAIAQVLVDAVGTQPKSHQGRVPKHRQEGELAAHTSKKKTGKKKTTASEPVLWEKKNKTLKHD